MRPLLTLCVGFTLTALTAVGADDTDKPIYTDPDNAGPDYAFQGEYTGELTIDDQPVPIGAHVIARGDGKFDVVGYFGGLPGDGWQRYDEAVEGRGQRNDDKVEVTGDNWTATITSGVMSVLSESGEDMGDLKHVVRKSKTLGAKPPAAALILFDGKSADAFDNGKLSPDGYLLADCSSKAKFGDHSLHLEFRTPFKPHARGQARGNSGVYVQSRYEVQVLDSFGLEGRNNECGGIYSIKAPKLNMCYPPLTWQTYDIDFTAARYDDAGEKTKHARITVRHNGVTIMQDVELPKGTPGRHPEGPEKDALYLQGHGNPVVYRNIWVVEK